MSKTSIEDSVDRFVKARDRLKLAFQNCKPETIKSILAETKTFVEIADKTVYDLCYSFGVVREIRPRIETPPQPKRENGEYSRYLADEILNLQEEIRKINWTLKKAGVLKDDR